MPRNIFLPQDELETRSISLLDLIKIDASTPILATSNANTVRLILEDGSSYEDYLPTEGYLAHGGIEYTSELYNQQLEIIFAGRPATKAALTSNNIQGKEVIIRKILKKTPFENSIIFQVFSGIVESVNFVLNEDNDKIFITASGIFANFEKQSAYGYTSLQSQHLLYPDDMGFRYAQRDVVNITWEDL